MMKVNGDPVTITSNKQNKESGTMINNAHFFLSFPSNKNW